MSTPPSVEAPTRAPDDTLGDAETVLARPSSRAVPVLAGAVAVLCVAVLALAVLLTRTNSPPDVEAEPAVVQVAALPAEDAVETAPAIAPPPASKVSSVPDDGSSAGGAVAPPPPPQKPAEKPRSAPPQTASFEPSTPPLPPPPVEPDLPALPSAGAERYTMVNLHPRGDFLSTVNYQYAGLLPLCTRVRIDERSRSRLSFTVLQGGARYEYNYHRSAGDFDADIGRVFGTTCNRSRARQLSALDQQGIRAGRALPGMTKDGVLLAIGYPPPHRTPSLQSDAWRYWVGRSATIVVQFRDGRVVRIER